ncbi:hypothetical protein [Pseudoduganella violaceinigra]|uniref:hypothetical protein n=1 Tax=Pseudoduganella violaceinigra TaxID=246602 RepID=UPI0003FB302D|nr:hypothetical protein [Pseudoduganella violaceinigra]
MATLRIVLLALVLLLNYSVAAAKPVRACCLDADCPATACLDMGCLPGAVPPLAGPADMPGLAPYAGREAAAPEPHAPRSTAFDSIWRPPR